MIGRKTFIFLSLIVAVLFLGVVYAAINNVTLNITGNVAATPDQGNFKVYFTGTPAKSGNGTIAVALGSGSTPTTATMNVSGLTTAGQTATATFTIKNNSNDIDATLSHKITNSNSAYFTVNAAFASTSLASGGTTTITVEVKLNKTLVSSNQSKSITVAITAAPKEK